MGAAILAEGLAKSYGKTRALAGLDLDVPEATVLGVLGPNGAGKTTAVRVLTTLLRPDAGRAEVAGIDVLRHPDLVRRLIGLSGQYAAVDERLTGRENLDMVARLYHLGRRAARTRAGELLAQFGLTDAADRTVMTYSGGMRRRLVLAAALVARPQVLFLDEPTTGLDPRSRLDLWDVIAELVREGATLLLTTQYLEEADQLADSIAVVDSGRVIARGTSDELKAQVGGERLSVVVHSADEVPRVLAAVRGFASGEPVVDEHGRRVTLPISGRNAGRRTGGASRVLVDVVRALDAEGVEVLDLALRRPTLDDVFLALTGHSSDQDAT